MAYAQAYPILFNEKSCGARWAALRVLVLKEQHVLYDDK